MSTNNEIVKKFFEENPATAALAKKYGLKDEFIVVDAFSDSDKERLVLNDECMDKFLKAYLFSYSESAQSALNQAKENGESLEISAALLWMDKNFDKAIEYHMDYLIKKHSNIEYNYVNLSNIISKVVRMCYFAQSKVDAELIKKVANHLKKENSLIIWDDEEYDTYIKLSSSSYNQETKSSFNTGVSDCLKDDSLDILTVLKTLKNVKSFLSNLKPKQLEDILLKEEIENLELNTAMYIPNLYKRLYRENKLEEVLNNPDKYLVSEQLAEYKKEEDEKYNADDFAFEENPVSESEDVITKEAEPTKVEDLITFINVDIVKDVENCLKKYIDADFSKDEVINTIVKDVAETLFSMDKDIYNSSSLNYDQEVLINSILDAFSKNGLFISKDLVESCVNDAKNNIIPVGRDLNFLFDNSESLAINDEIINDFRAIISPVVINKFNTLDMIKKEQLAASLIDLLLASKKDIYNKASEQYNEELVINSIYTVLKDYSFSKTFVENSVKKDDMFIEDINLPEETNEALDNELYKIFNIEPENNVKNNLEVLYENANNTELYKERILKAYSNLINSSMYGTLRDLELIEKQFNLFCSENDINYTDEFINSLPDVVKDRYTTPIVRQEQPEKKKGEVFKIVRRYIPKTSVKTQKRIYASIAGVGIISFLFMTGVKIISPETAAESCTESFTRIFHSDLIGNIFGDIKTYFASIAASIGGSIGYVVKDEKENKSRRM